MMVQLNCVSWKENHVTSARSVRRTQCSEQKQLHIDACCIEVEQNSTTAPEIMVKVTLEKQSKIRWTWFYSTIMS